MPIRIPDNLPAASILEQEHIFVMYQDRAYAQDIRPLKICILNLMPTKIETETQLLRQLSNTPLQVDVDLVHMSSYKSKNTPEDHFVSFYKTFAEIRDSYYDGCIITGAPVEHLEFEEVFYWDELCDFMSWTRTNVYSTLHICWGAQAALYFHYGIPKYPLPEKMFGVFPHYLTNGQLPRLFRGIDDVFYVPQSRHTEIKGRDILANPLLTILSESEFSGVYAVSALNGRQIFLTGHAEYDPYTLLNEYQRDVKKGLPIEVPINYFPDDDPTKKPLVRWRSTAYLMFSNWLNYYVYQETPYLIETISEHN